MGLYRVYEGSNLSYQISKMSNTRVTSEHSNDDDFKFEEFEGTTVVKVIFAVIRICLQIVAVCFTHLAYIMEPRAHYALVGVCLAAVAVVLHIWDIIWDLVRIPELRPVWKKLLNKTRVTFGLICGLYLLLVSTFYYFNWDVDDVRASTLKESYRSTKLHFYTSVNLLGALYIEINLLFKTDPSESRYNRDLGICRSNIKAITAEGVSLVITIGLEILSACFEQASSPSKPHFALLGLLLAIVAVLISLSELIRKGRKERVKWRRWGMLGWFYHPSPRNELFGTLLDIYGLLGGIWQCIISTVQYICYRRHVHNPINLCLLPIIFVICLAVSKLNSRPMAIMG